MISIASDVIWPWVFAGLVVLAICVECLVLSSMLDRLQDLPSKYTFGDRNASRAAWITLSVSFLLVVCASGVWADGRVWTPFLLTLAAIMGAVAFYKIDRRSLSHAKLMALLSAVLTLMVAAMSFGRAMLGTGMGPLRSLLILCFAIALGYGALLISRSQRTR